MCVCLFLHKDTRVCACEGDAVHSRSIYISTQGQEQEETCTLTTRLPEETQRWSQALWQHVFNMSESQYRTLSLCCNIIQYKNALTFTLKHNVCKFFCFEGAGGKRLLCAYLLIYSRRATAGLMGCLSYTYITILQYYII